MAVMNKLDEIEEILSDCKQLATRYKELTGKSLGIAGEIAEFNATKLLGLELVEVRESGYDATGKDGRKIQIRGRCLPDKPNPDQKVGLIRLDHQWDAVLLVLMSQKFEVTEIWEATHNDVEKEIQKPGSKTRHSKGALSVSGFKKIGKKIWPSS
jgi:hypothetical protein